MKVVISSGHGKYVRGASGIIDEVDEARRVVDRVAQELGSDVIVFHDNTSTTQKENLNRIVSFHNSQTRDLDISVHFNAYVPSASPKGCEVLYVSSTGQAAATKMVDAICEAVPFINRGPKKRTDLAFLNNTNEPAILIETCFVDSKADTDIYKVDFDTLCEAIASTIGSHPPSPEAPEEALFQIEGKCSYFGGPDDTGVSPSEGLAFIYGVEEAPQLFLPYQPSGTTGLARRLNPYVDYVACRWDYDITSRDMLKNGVALVKAKGISIKAFPADWGPHQDTGRVADLSPSLMDALGLTTDDEVEVIFPSPQ